MTKKLQTPTSKSSKMKKKAKKSPTVVIKMEDKAEPRVEIDKFQKERVPKSPVIHNQKSQDGSFVKRKAQP
jgi:hypothetical protein